MARVVGIVVAVLVVASVPVASAAGVTPAKQSDFNGDGYADLAIGVPSEDVNGWSDAGAVNVLYGSPTGISAAGDQFWTQDSAGIPGTSTWVEHFGTTLASGDFDRDGFADLAIAAPDEQTGTNVEGSLTIIYGTASGLAAAGAQTWIEADLGILLGDSGVFGATLAAGDYDGDAYTDLAIGVRYRDIGDVRGAGVVDIMFGSSGGLTATDAMQFSQGTPGVPGDPNDFEDFGIALAAGDLDGDGIDDLAVGVSSDWVDGDVEFAGGVNVLYGTLTGPSAVGAQLWTQDTPGIGGSASPMDEFGSALAIGDFDRDGHDDLAVGVPSDHVGGIRSGGVNVIYGSANGLTAGGSKWWHQGSAGVPGSNEDGDSFGVSLAAGDFDSDGADDLAVGVRGEDVGRLEAAGAVTILYGSSSGIRSTGARNFTQDSPGVPGRSESKDRFGSALAAGNFGRSGREDLAIAAFHEKTGSARSSGGVNVLYGRSTGLSGIGAQSWTQDSPGVASTPAGFEDFGWDLTP